MELCEGNYSYFGIKQSHSVNQSKKIKIYGVFFSSTRSDERYRYLGFNVNIACDGAISKAKVRTTSADSR